ncbi:HAD family phosphatase [Clostridium sp. MSJ-8]|uniref:HAD family hydrolase n=1 Tax=Clostridium sp. MSJ-8 TaxID=2841510 RepID=UPI001C0EA119|nr:HAD family phosphatase [Clostridium sp. MSJ-8]MBU5487283.1 HAD family phosphatase [Clostridium sp. MSJ-8]
MNNNIKAVVFDMDGLMFDTERVYVEAMDYIGEKIGLGKLGYIVKKTLGMNKTSSRKVWLEELGENYDEEIINREIIIYYTEYYKNNTVPVKEGLYELLEFLSENRYKVAVASSSNRETIMKHLRETNIDKYFSVIVSGEDFEVSKPNPDIYIKACELLEEEPINCIALEDSKNGLLAAYSAGCKPVMIPDLYEAEDEIKKILYKKFDSLKDVVNLLKH